MARFFPMLSEALICNKALNQLLIQHLHNISCYVKRVIFIPSEDNAYTQQVTLSNQHVFGKEVLFEENCVDSTLCESLEEFHHRLKIISLIIGEATCEIGFFESGYQLAVSIPEETHSIVESLEKFNEGNTEELIKFHPSIEFLLCLIDRMKVDNPILSKLQLEIVLVLFQQLRIDTFNEFTYVRNIVEHWIETNEKESELLFSNLENEKWKSDQLLSQTFFSLAFSDINGNVKQNICNYYPIGFSSAINNPRYFSILLSAIYGNELSLSEWVNARKCYSTNTLSKEIISILDEMGITQERCESYDNENTFFQNYPNCLLNTVEIEYSQYMEFMDPRSVCHIVNDEGLGKLKINKHSFSNYILSDYFIVKYLVRKCLAGETKKEREVFLQELKQIDLSAYYYVKCDEERALLPRLSFAQLSIKHGLGICYRKWGNYKKFPTEEAIKLKKMVDYLFGFDIEIKKSCN